MTYRWLTATLQTGTIILTVGTAHAGISGRIEMLVEQDNQRFQNNSRIEKRLDLVYDDPAAGLRGGLALALAQRQGKQVETLSQFYLEKKLNNKGSLLSLGRLQRSDALGFYILDGLLFKRVADKKTLTFYGGVPSRIDEFHTLEGKSLYGFDAQISIPRFMHYTLSGRFGWQRLKQQQTIDRLNIGWRGIHQQTPALFSPSSFSLTGSYLVGENVWESAQLSAYKDLKNNTQSARLRIDYEIYEPGKKTLTFKDRFYSLYARGRQSQFKTGYQFKQGRRHTWSLSGRRISREFGGNGYAAVVTMDYHNDRGWLLITQLDQMALADEHIRRFYFEVHQSLSSLMRGTLSGVLQQQKRLINNNYSTGIEVRLERRIKSGILPSPLWVSAHASTVRNSRSSNEYRIAIRLSYRFDDRTRALF